MLRKNTYIPSKKNRNSKLFNSCKYKSNIHPKQEIIGELFSLIFFGGLFLFFIVGASFSSNDTYAAAINITNQTVIAILNVSNTEPNITNVVVDDDLKIPPDEIDLIANGAKVVICNATIWDYNGAGDILSRSNTSATLYIDSEGSGAADDNNYHYTNESCENCIASSDPNIAYCDCKFAVQYYANYSDSWRCNFTVEDSGGHAQSEEEVFLGDSEVSGLVTVTKVLGIDSPLILDYGNLSVTQTSEEIIHNITNVGNVKNNFTVRGYGGTNESVGINYTMICDFGNITFDYQKYEFGTDKIGTTVFSEMYNLTNQTILTEWTIPAKKEDDYSGSESNSSLWRLQIPSQVGGTCNGTIIFGAIDASS